MPLREFVGLSTNTSVEHLVTPEDMAALRNELHDLRSLLDRERDERKNETDKLRTDTAQLGRSVNTLETQMHDVLQDLESIRKQLTEEKEKLVECAKKVKAAQEDGDNLVMNLYAKKLETLHTHTQELLKKDQMQTAQLENHQAEIGNLKLQFKKVKDQNPPTLSYKCTKCDHKWMQYRPYQGNKGILCSQCRRPKAQQQSVVTQPEAQHQSLSNMTVSEESIGCWADVVEKQQEKKV